MLVPLAAADLGCSGSLMADRRPYLPMRVSFRFVQLCTYLFLADAGGVRQFADQLLPGWLGPAAGRNIDLDVD